MSELPPYTVRVSARAKRAHLKVLPPGKVEVVIPKRFSRQRVAPFVAEHRQWLNHHLRQMQVRFGQQPLLPEIIALPALGEEWRVRVTEGARTGVRSAVGGEMQLVYHDPAAVPAELQRWLQRRARDTLPTWLRAVSEEFALPFNRVTIRGQRTRWGSCSSQKNINLNRAMLLLDTETVRYLMIHELCHTVHLNHSPQFWALVGRCMPEYAAIDRRLRRAMDGLPRWVWC